MCLGEAGKSSHIQRQDKRRAVGMETVVVDEVGFAGKHHSGELLVVTTVEAKMGQRLVGWVAHFVAAFG